MGNMSGSVFKEQFVTFPRFLMSGAWLRALRRGQGSFGRHS
jgi:hypothetical protein